MWAKTLRGKLTLWNLGVLSATLILFGLLLNFANQQRISATIDRDLMGRARQFALGPPQRRPGPPDEFGGPPNDRRPPEGVDLQGPAPEPRRSPAEDPLGEIHRPQIFGPRGRMVNSSQSQPFDASLIAAGMAGQEKFSTTTYQSEHVRVLVEPVVRDGQRRGFAMFARELRDYDALWAGQTITLLILLPIAIFVAGAGALFLTNRALKPIADVTAAASTISAKDLTQRLAVVGQDELAVLAGTFNKMIERLEHSFNDLTQAYDNQKRFTADASHELRTPLTRLKLATSGTARENNIEQLREALKIADSAADSMSRIVQQLLLLSRADAGQLLLQKQPLDLRVLAAAAVDSFPQRRIALELPDTPVMVKGDEDHLQRVITNLIQNAMRHTAEGKCIGLTVAIQEQSAVLKVVDQGEGIAPEHLPHLGERFYRVDHARSRADGGFGLGLSICKTILEELRGTIAIESSVGKGTVVSVTLPLL